jgi:hypothetical protein
LRVKLQRPLEVANGKADVREPVRLEHDAVAIMGLTTQANQRRADGAPGLLHPSGWTTSEQAIPVS